MNADNRYYHWQQYHNRTLLRIQKHKDEDSARRGSRIKSDRNNNGVITIKKGS